MLYAVLSALAAGLLALDQWVKAWTAAHFAAPVPPDLYATADPPLPFLPGVLELTRVHVTGTALRDKVDFYSLSDFNVVVAKPDRRVIYSGCQWSEISEAASAGDLLFETVTIVASRRVEVVV